MDMYQILAKLNGVNNESTKAAVEQLKNLNQVKETDHYTGFKNLERLISEKVDLSEKDVGKHNNKTTGFKALAKKAGKEYGSKEAGERVAGAVYQKMKSKGQVEEGNDGNLANNAKPYDKVTRGDVVAGRLGKDAMGGKSKKATKNWKDLGKEYSDKPKVGDRKATTKGEVEYTKTGMVHRARTGYGGEKSEYDDGSGEKSQRKKIGAKINKGTSKLMTRESELDPNEYNQEGDMAKGQLHTIIRHAEELERVLSDKENLPEWVQEKLGQIKGMMTTVADYIETEHERNTEQDTGEEGMHPGEAEVEIAERSTSKKQARTMSAAAHDPKFAKKVGIKQDVAKEFNKADTGTKQLSQAMKEKNKSEESNKEDKPKKVKETTVAGAVATGGASSGKANGMFGKGVYESFSRQIENKINEGMTIDISTDSSGQKSFKVSATEAEAEELGQMLKMAGLFGGDGKYSAVCPNCGSADCGCDQEAETPQAIEMPNAPAGEDPNWHQDEPGVVAVTGTMDAQGAQDFADQMSQDSKEVDEEYANEPNEFSRDTDYMTKHIAGGLNGSKTTGQTTTPVINRDPARQHSYMESNEELDEIRKLSGMEEAIAEAKVEEECSECHCAPCECNESDKTKETKKDQVEEAVEQRLFDLYKRYTKG
jgi:hypothetical protein